MELQRREKNQRIAYIYLLPWLIGFAVFQLYPFFSSFYYSLTNLTMLKPAKFVGLRNYIRIFTQDATFVQSLKVTVLYVLMAVPLKLLMALFIAMLLNLKVRANGVYRTFIICLPSWAAAWAFPSSGVFCLTRDGLINLILSKVGLGPVDWLGNPNVALFTISLLSVWQFGSAMVLFLAALKQIPTYLYEAAMVDGAGPIRSFFKITIPMISRLSSLTSYAADQCFSRICRAQLDYKRRPAKLDVLI